MLFNKSNVESLVLFLNQFPSYDCTILGIVSLVYVLIQAFGLLSLVSEGGGGGGNLAFFL